MVEKMIISPSGMAICFCSCIRSRYVRSRRAAMDLVRHYWTQSILSTASAVRLQKEIRSLAKTEKLATISNPYECRTETKVAPSGMFEVVDMLFKMCPCSKVPHAHIFGKAEDGRSHRFTFEPLFTKKEARHQVEEFFGCVEDLPDEEILELQKFKSNLLLKIDKLPLPNKPEVEN